MTIPRHNIVLCIEPVTFAWLTSSQIGNLLMNRFSIDEDANFEILKIINFEHTFSTAKRGKAKEIREGQDLII